jgi:nitrogen fixation NifU-like protein
MENSETLQEKNRPEAIMDDLYRSVVMEHYRSSQNRHPVDGANLIAEGKNPLCGDEVRIEIRMNNDRVEDVGFIGEGCAISIAAASMFTEMLQGMTRQDAENLIRDFSRFIKGDRDNTNEDALEDLVALEGVARFPVRIKCALLPFMAVREALNESA